MKICTKCKIEKELSEFRYRNKSLDLKQSWCKECADEHKKGWYLKNKVKYRELSTIWSKKRRRELQDYLIDFLRKHPCVDCGNTNIIVLDFDHRGNKEHSISNMMSSSLEKVKKEISKCDVRCSNCHRIKTAKDFNWFKSYVGEVGTL